jgi:hypothetical protein
MVAAMRPVAAIFSACSKDCSIRLRLETSRRILDAPNHPAIFILDWGDGKRDVDEPSILRAPDGLEVLDSSPSANVFQDCFLAELANGMPSV